MNPFPFNFIAVRKKLSSLKPREAFSCLILLLTGASAFLISLALFLFLHELVHAMGHSAAELSFVSRAFDDGTPLPVLLTFAWAAYFATDEILRLRSGRKEPDPSSCDSSRFFICGKILFFGIFTWFWIADGRHLGGELYPETSYILCAGLLASVALGAVGNFMPRWFGWLTLLPPIITAAWLQPLAVEIDSIYGFHLHLFTLWPCAERLYYILAVIAVLGAGLLWVERRLYRESFRTASFLCATFWLMAIAMAFDIVMPFHHMCLKMGPNPAQRTASLGVLGLLGVAILVRYLFHIATRRNGNNPPSPDDSALA